MWALRTSARVSDVQLPLLGPLIARRCRHFVRAAHRAAVTLGIGGRQDCAPVRPDSGAHGPPAQLTPDRRATPRFGKVRQVHLFVADVSALSGRKSRCNPDGAPDLRAFSLVGFGARTASRNWSLTPGSERPLELHAGFLEVGSRRALLDRAGGKSWPGRASGDFSGA